MDLHHNLFYSYRGSNPDIADRDRQLENNLTKALINTLSLGGAAVWRPFLAELGVPDALDAKFLLQRHDLPSRGAANKRQRVLLGISKRKSAWSPDAVVDTSDVSVPDAWVYGNEFAVLVESKVNGDFSPGQMQAHRNILRSNQRPKLWTWGQIHGLFGSLLPSLTDPSALLVKQFIQFLEYSGMSGFTGFQPEHFNYFLLHDDEDARRWVLEQVKDLARQVNERLHEFAQFYESYDVGNLKRTDSDCWVAFGPRAGAYRNVTHQTVSLASDGLRVFVNAELKAATDQIKTVVVESPGRLRERLQDLHTFKPFELVLQERVQRQASVYNYTPKMRLDSSMLADRRTSEVAWDAFVQTVRQLPLPYLRIERLILPPTLLKPSKGDPRGAIDLVVEILKRNHRVVDLLNAEPIEKERE